LSTAIIGWASFVDHSTRPHATHIDYFVGFATGEAVVCAGEAVSVAGELAGACVASGEACGVTVGCASGLVDCSTECEPVIAGIESTSAINIKAAAAPMVIFDRILAVPRGPNAVLEMLLEKSAPASALPGCNNTTTISTTHDKTKSPYKK
jgi:hypothetical protein